MTFDVPMHSRGAGPDSEAFTIRLPKALSRALGAKGYNRVRIEVTEAGLLLTPYAGDHAHSLVVDIPEWSAP